MPILVAIGLLVFFSLITLGLNRLSSFTLCAVCVGTSLTWFTLSFLILSGLTPAADYLMLVALLMGGTVVGIVYQAEKKFGGKRIRFRQKELILIAGFTLAYLFLVDMSWITFTAALIILAAAAYVVFLRSGKPRSNDRDSKAVKTLEDKMKDCC